MNVSNFAEGGDLVDAVGVANAMGFHPYQIASDLDKSAKFMDIVDYMKNFDNKEFLLTKLVSHVDKDESINHVWKYVSLHKMMGEKTKELDDIRKQLQTYER